MTKTEAQKLIKKVFENPFDKNQFIRLMKNLLKFEEKTFVYKGNTIPKAFQFFVKTCERIGKYKDPKGKTVDILIVQLEKETSLERARSAQRNFIGRYLKGSRGGVLKDGALVAFISPDKEDWRFSFVKIDYKFNEQGKVKDDLTPARRYSFLVGKNESSHTAQSWLLPLLQNDDNNPTLEDLENAFSVEKVTKEFFEKYRELYLRLKDSLDKVVAKDLKIKKEFENKKVNLADFCKKLLGQIVFLYFLQKKGWFGVKRNSLWGEGSKAFLRELFNRRKDIYKAQGAESSQNFFNDVLEPLFYEALGREHEEDYYSRFDCRIPFLNGGLFEPIGNYNWIKTDILFPDSLFSNNETTKEGDVGSGIMDIFDRYNFTVKEDEPLEKEVAVDPEMLGKVFENLLEVKDRKSKGTYYTPREIVHYMCQESLINYLATELKGKVKKEEIEELIKISDSSVEHDTIYQEKMLLETSEKKPKNTGYQSRYSKSKLPDKVREHASLIDEKLANIRICDPAVGSGAFPVGMMNEIVRMRDALTPHIRANEKTETQNPKTSSESDARTPYHFKRHAIEHCLYGVDIDTSAIEIAKLRLWLSLVVDEEDRNKVQPLPNLDYKMVCGNSLLGLNKDDGSGTKDAFYELNIKEFHKKKNLYFNETSSLKKQKYKQEIEQLIDKMTEKKKLFDFEIYFSEIFQEKKGFDVVIANPPYVEHKKLKGISKLLESYRVYSGTADLYVYFYERSLNILHRKGILTYISSNKFIKTRYGTNIRSLLSEYRIHTIVDFTKIHIFEALVASCILIISKFKAENDIFVAFPDDTFSGSLSDFIYKNHIKIHFLSLNENPWCLESNSKMDLKNKIEKNTKKLGEIQGIKIFRGVTTGYNPAFIIDADIKKRLIKLDIANKKIIKPLLQGRNIRKWFYIKSSKFLIFTKQGVNIKSYSGIKNYLLKFKKNLEPGKGRKSGSYKWYEIQDNTAYYNEFEKEKIIWGLTANRWAFAWDEERHFLPSNGYILTSEKLHLKYILALINSRLMEFYFSFIGIMTAGGAFTLKHETVFNFPIKISSYKEQNSLIDLIDKLLTITKTEGYLQNPDKQAQVQEYENQIDRLIYKLYGLTPEEIKIVEEGE